jgi:hypothetical protein
MDHVVSMRFMTAPNSFQPKWDSYVEMASNAESMKLVQGIDGNLLSNRFSRLVKRNNQMPQSKLCSFCISAATCKNPETERNSNCQEYMLKIENEFDCSGRDA